MAVRYEWDLEYEDEHGDVVDHDFYDSAVEVVQASRSVKLQADWFGLAPHIVLVRTEDRGVRSWAYVKDGVLPEWFEDASGRRDAPVPNWLQIAWRVANG